jgi:hypothetical protein
LFQFALHYMQKPLQLMPRRLQIHVFSFKLSL